MEQREPGFLAANSPCGDRCAFFESDGDTAYFYMYDRTRAEGHRIVGAIHVWTGNAPITDEAIRVRWSANGRRAGLFIDGTLWAMFDDDRAVGGNYVSGVSAPLGTHADDVSWQ